MRDSPTTGDEILALALRLERTTAGAAITIHGTPCLPDLSGGLWFAAERTLVVSDLHLEKGSAFAERRGSLLPPYDTRETLAQLHEVVARFDPARVVAHLRDAVRPAEAGRLHRARKREFLRAVAGPAVVRRSGARAGQRESGKDGGRQRRATAPRFLCEIHGSLL